MPDLKSSLKELDKDFLQIVARMWEVEDNGSEPEELSDLLLKTLRNPQLFMRILEQIQPDSKAALNDLISHHGKIPWGLFCRQHGELRIMGSGKVEREEPQLHPISTTEWLWYRGIIFKSFFGQGTELQEYAYLPDEFLHFLRPSSDSQMDQPVGNVIQIEKAWHIQEANDHIVDDTCTLLSALRMGKSLDDFSQFNIPVEILIELLFLAGILDEHHQPSAEKTRQFLETPRIQALSSLVFTWLDSKRFNELLMIPDFVCEGRLKNHPLEARNEIIKYFRRLPVNQWWDTSSFIEGIRMVDPDFLRPAGDYESWLIRDRSTNEYLRGFSNWDKVEGRLIFLILNLCRWLGMMDLACQESTGLPAAFRITDSGKALLDRKIPAVQMDENEKITARSNGQLLLPRFVHRAVRYQIARFCEWLGEKEDAYRYFISPTTLQQAERQDLKISQLVALLKKNGKQPLPPTLLQALQHWEKNHLQAHFDQAVLLRVTESTILDQLERSRAKRFLLERISPTLMVIKSGGQNAVQQTLIELGYLSEIDPTL